MSVKCNGSVGKPGVIYERVSDNCVGEFECQGCDVCRQPEPRPRYECCGKVVGETHYPDCPAKSQASQPAAPALPIEDGELEARSANKRPLTAREFPKSIDASLKSKAEDMQSYGDYRERAAFRSIPSRRIDVLRGDIEKMRDGIDVNQPYAPASIHAYNKVLALIPAPKVSEPKSSPTREE